MKVWSVEYFDYDDHRVLGVFSSQEKASEFIEKCQIIKKDQYLYYPKNMLDILDYEVDKPEDY